MRKMWDRAESDDMGTSCSGYCARKQVRMQTVLAALIGGPGNADEAPAIAQSMIAMISLQSWRALLSATSKKARNVS